MTDHNAILISLQINNFKKIITRRKTALSLNLQKTVQILTDPFFKKTKKQAKRDTPLITI
jgi:hypothetical protein